MSSNNSRPSINRLPRIITPHPAPLTIFSFFYPPGQVWVESDPWQFKLWTKFEIWNTMFSLFDLMIFWFIAMIKQTI